MEIKNNVIARNYRLLEKIGSGSFGSIYKGQHVRTNEYVAIKIEKKDKCSLLIHEATIYVYLKDCIYVPPIKWFGIYQQHYYIIMKMLGPSLQEVSRFLSLPMIFHIGVHLLGALKDIHQRGLIHRDLKPHNLLFRKDPIAIVNTNTNINTNININKDSFFLYVIDFGFATGYSEKCETSKLHATIGSKNYASINSHTQCELSRRDDLESLFYILLYCQTGNLPWNHDENEEIIVRKKRTMHINNTLYSTTLIDGLQYVQHLGFYENPDYDFLTNLFTNR